MSVLVIAEHDNAALSPSTLAVIRAGLQLTGPVSLLVAGYHCDPVAETASALEGVHSVIHVDAGHYEHFLAEEMALLVKELCQDVGHVLVPANTFGKNLLPRVAGLLNSGMVSDVVKILSDDTFIRPMYAGNVLATVQSTDTVKLLSIRTTAFDGDLDKTGEAGIVKRDAPSARGLSRFIKLEQPNAGRPDLTMARVVIAGGRGLGSAAQFTMLEALADKLGGAVAGTRAAVDAGYITNDLQVGQTGKVVAPDLYIAVGVSGAIQHIAGMKESKCIVAINRDPEAPIFEVADYGLVGDLFHLLPELNDSL